MKVLINLPRLDTTGGVGSYYLTLRPYLDEGKVYFEIGATGNPSGFFGSLRRLTADYAAFYRLLRVGRFDLVHLNPSLMPASLLRDGLFLMLAKARRQKVLVFFRGWDKEFEAVLKRRFRLLFVLVYGRADAYVVLAEEFRAVLQEFGLKAPVWLDTTAVSDEVLHRAVNRSGSDAGRISLLFMSRLEPGKGCELAIRAFALLRRGGIDGRLVIAGDGSRRQMLEALVDELSVPNVEFVGYLGGEDKASAFLSADVFLFPSVYGEGMPNAVLEAMGYGLPVVTRPVGGLRDFFEDGKMGYISESRDPAVFAGYLQRLAVDPSLRENMGRHNRSYAAKRFAASRVARRLQHYYECTVGS